MRKLKTDIDFEIFWNIYCEAFPVEERRGKEHQKETMQDSRYSILMLEHEKKVVGFLTYWDLDSFLFMEHFAIRSDYRCRGIGRECMSRFLSSLSKPAIGEVEFDKDEFSDRRIAYYKRLGMKLNDYEYLQPPYEIGQQPIPMKIVSFPDRLSLEDFEKARRLLYQIVYKV